jgi:23S rRNA G2445 N2-methylase RlmL
LLGGGRFTQRFLLTCAAGFEDISAIEAEALGGRVLGIRDGRIIVEGDVRLIYRLNAWARTAHRILLLLGVFRVGGLDDIRERASGIEYDLIGPGRSFAVRGEVNGVHGFTPGDVTSTVARAVMGSRGSSGGVRPRIDTADPDVVIRADVIGEELFISVDTTGESLHVREWRRFNHPSSIMPSLAYALVMFAGWRGGPLLDTFTGGATIPIEAALRWIGRTVHEHREYAYRRLPIYDPSMEAEERRDDPDPLPDTPRPGDIRGLEVNPKYYSGAMKNVESAGVSGAVSISLADSTRWEPDRRFPFIVTNPPYGISPGGRKRVAGLYRRFASRLPAMLEPDGVVVAITTEHRQMAAALSAAGLRILDGRRGRHGNLWVGAVKAALF